LYHRHRSNDCAIAGKLLAEPEQLAFEIEDEAGHAGLESFATECNGYRLTAEPEPPDFTRR